VLNAVYCILGPQCPGSEGDPNHLVLALLVLKKMHALSAHSTETFNTV